MPSCAVTKIHVKIVTAEPPLWNKTKYESNTLRSRFQHLPRHFNCCIQSSLEELQKFERSGPNNVNGDLLRSQGVVTTSNDPHSLRQSHMDAFEDENPFEDGNHLPSEESSTSQVALYEPPSDQLSPTSPKSHPHPSSSPGPQKSPQTNYKTDFCCGTDRALHSGEDVEILVRHD